LPPWQAAPPGQFCPQAPQWVTSVAVSVQRPAHRVVPAWQPGMQLLLQTRPGVQRWPHMPQLLASAAVSTQTPAHSAVPVGHEHLPATHSAPPVQATPQPPQWPAFVVVFTHAPSHKVLPVGQLATQLPALHDWPLGQATPQVPQLRGSVLVEMQTPPQRVCPAGQTQRPDSQTVPPAQTLPQAPQWAGSRPVSTQARPQAVSPAEHPLAQRAALQTWSGLHAWSHSPQWSGLLAGSMHRSRQRIWPALHGDGPGPSVGPSEADPSAGGPSVPSLLMTGRPRQPDKAVIRASSSTPPCTAAFNLTAHLPAPAPDRES
jgi:hypothetical protein